MTRGARSRFDLDQVAKTLLQDFHTDFHFDLEAKSSGLGRELSRIVQTAA
jgi:hypothetical protein